MPSEQERFPIMRPYGKNWERLPCPRSIPWYLLQEAQAKSNHDQTLKRLAERGGLAPSEAVAVIEGRRWQNMGEQASIDRLVELVRNDIRARVRDRVLLAVRQLALTESTERILVSAADSAFEPDPPGPPSPPIPPRDKPVS